MSGRSLQIGCFPLVAVRRVHYPRLISASIYTCLSRHIRLRLFLKDSLLQVTPSIFTQISHRLRQRPLSGEAIFLCTYPCTMTIYSLYIFDRQVRALLHCAFVLYSHVVVH